MMTASSDKNWNIRGNEEKEKEKRRAIDNSNILTLCPNQVIKNVKVSNI